MREVTLPLKTVMRMLKGLPTERSADVAIPPPEWIDLTIDVAMRRYRMEYEFVGCVLSDPLEGLRRALTEKIKPWHIEDEALRIIYCSALVCLDNDRLTGNRESDGLAVVMLAKLGLMRADLWDEDGAGVSKLSFGVDSLVVILEGHPHAITVSSLAVSLIEFDSQIDEGRKALCRSRRILEELVSR